MLAGNIGRVGRPSPTGGASLPSLDLNFLGSETLDPRFTFSRANPIATRFNSAGQLVTMGANTPRFDYDPNTAVTNWIINSANLTAGNTPINVICTITTTSAPSPDGSGVYQLAAANVGAGVHYIGKSASTVPPSAASTFSSYIKASGKRYIQMFHDDAVSNGGFVNFDTTTKTVVAGPTIRGTGSGYSASVSLASDDAIRVSITGNPGSGAASTRVGFVVIDTPTAGFAASSVGDAESGMLYWGWQLETSAAPTAYIATSGAAASGNATPRGLLIEDARTNSIPNSTMVGASAGPPTLPTNWIGTFTTNVVLATGVLPNGMAYVDIQFTGGAVTYSLRFDAIAAIAATVGQVWTNSFYVALIGGSLTNVTLQANIAWFDAGSVFIAQGVNAFTPTATLTRVSTTQAMTGATAFVSPLLRGVGSGAFDVTLRIAAPQLELGGFMTSYIPTSTVAVARSADAASMPLSGWYNAIGTSITDAMFPLSVINAQQGMLLFDDGTAVNRRTIRGTTGGGGNQINATDVVASVATAVAQTAVAMTPGTPFKVGVAASGTGLTICKDGAAVVSGVGGPPPGMTTMRLGQNGIGAAYMNGYIRRVRYFPRALSSIELQANTL